jgi:hypothetical protein
VDDEEVNLKFAELTRGVFLEEEPEALPDLTHLSIRELEDRLDQLTRELLARMELRAVRTESGRLLHAKRGATLQLLARRANEES